MALSINRFTLPSSSTPWSLSGLWVAAGLAMVTLSGCTYFLLPEQSFAIAAALRRRDRAAGARGPSGRGAHGAGLVQQAREFQRARDARPRDAALPVHAVFLGR